MCYTPPMSLRSAIPVLTLAILIAGVTTPGAQNIPTPKLELIKQATTAMKLDQRVQNLIQQKVEARVQTIRLENPGLSDSMVGEIRTVLARVHESRLEGRDGLMPRIYMVLDRRLTEDDLKFAVDFRGSDQGKRYRELVPRVVAESLEAARVWSETLEPSIQIAMEDAFRGHGLKF